MADSTIVAKVDELAPLQVETDAYRHVDPTRNPLSGAGARIYGGRWNPPESFSVVYLGLTPEVVDAEFARMAARQGLKPQDFLPRLFVRVGLTLQRVLDLSAQTALQAVGLGQDARALDLRQCQAVGEAAHYVGLEGILAPSVTGRGDVLAVFTEQLAPTSTIRVIETALRESFPFADAAS